MNATPNRRLEDRIRELCAQAAEPDWRRVLAELRLAIREHALKTSNVAMAAVVGGQPQIMVERRERRNEPQTHSRDDSAVLCRRFKRNYN
jgi:hypothetical protein